MQQRSFVKGNQDSSPNDTAFFDRYGPIIFAYTFKHRGSREDVEDLTFEVFTTALEKNTLSPLLPEEQLGLIHTSMTPGAR